MRIESDGLGDMEVPADALYGAHTARALKNFPISGRRVHSALVRAMGVVKLACFLTNRELGFFARGDGRSDAIERACREMADGMLDDHVVVDALQGGAGTSTNMNVNEVIANRARAILGEKLDGPSSVSPIDDINRHQSTNDVYPTALKLAAIISIRELESSVLALQEGFQSLERRFSHVVKVGRTEYEDAVLTTLGRSMGAYAEALGRDRWRIYKCEERLRVVNLGGTAIGTGLTAPRAYIFRVVDALREESGVGFARAENLVEATQNADVFVEVSGMQKALASSLVKISSDLRLMASGPDSGIGEIALPARQVGSSIMPGKVNPVIPEALSQAAMLAIGYDATITAACMSGSLELNPFLPLVAHCLLDGMGALARACDIFKRFCVDGIEAREERCAELVDRSLAAATALVPRLGYDAVAALVKRSRAEKRALRDLALEGGLLTAEEYAELVSPEAVCRLGS